jgi:hypothetical protein
MLKTPTTRSVVTERPLDCHLGCAEFVGGVHETEINPTSEPGMWRSECRTCGTVLSVRHPCRDAAAARAINHAHTTAVAS